MHEIFEHTADLGLRITAADLESLFAEAGRALLTILVENAEAVRPSRTTNVRIDGEQRDYLLFDWLNELLYLFHTQRLLLGEFDVRLSPQGLEATALGEPYDTERHRLDHEVKAITYHGLRVEQADGGWLAEVIVDI